KLWMVLKDGQPYAREGSKGYYMRFNTRKSAQEEIDKDVAWDAYLARLYEQDRSGVYVWTVEEELELDAYAAVLKANELRWTFFGKFPIQVVARQQHERDAKNLQSDSWADAKRVHAEKRRVMAARVEAFRRAGLVFEDGGSV